MGIASRIFGAALIAACAVFANEDLRFADSCYTARAERAKGDKADAHNAALMIEAYKKEPKEYPGYLPKWIYPRIPFVVKPDDDNISKIKDSLNGVAWDDDSQVTASHTFKRDRNGVTHDRTEITIQFDLEG